ncbi:MAG: phosphatidate cytidylyltransferase [Clostridia bacterium]|nr:phosphatidate cytidylyltransferase [Clostridia bacterium]
MLKRIASAAIGIILLILVFFWGNLVMINIAVTAVALLALWEFYHAFKQKEIRPYEMLGYVVTLSILAIGFIPNALIKVFLFVIMPIILFIMFCSSVLTNMKRNVVDIAVTILGLIYVSFFFSFIAFICHIEHGLYYIWYVFGGAWMTDTFAFFIGSKFGKHKFTQISAKKSIEGCIAGVVGCAIFYAAYTFYLNSIGLEINLILMTFIGIIVSIISQIGDLAASSIKRYCGVKDFGNIMPGHGGALDRFDSVIMIAPFIYMLFQFIVI